MRKTLMTAALVAAPRALWACSVCFGQSDSPMARGTNMGIFLMLGITVTMLVAFASFFIYLARRVRMFEDADHTGRPVRPPEGGRYVQNVPNEGTAQC